MGVAGFMVRKALPGWLNLLVLAHMNNDER